MMNVSEKMGPSKNRHSSTESLGQYLSRMRRSKNIDLKNIAVTTRINYNILCGLESDSFDNLPNRTYLRGFIRCLAKEIAAEEEYALALLDKHLRPNTPPPADDAPSPAPPSLVLPGKLEKLRRQAYKIPTKYLAISLLALATLGPLGTGAFLIAKKVFVSTNQEASEAREGLPPPIAVKTERNDPGPAPTAEVPSSPETVPVPTPSPPSHGMVQTTATAPVAAPNIQTNLPRRSVPTMLGPIGLTKMQYPLYSLNPNHPKLDDKTLFPQKVRDAYAPGQEHVFINAVEDDSWLVYQSSGGPIKSFILRKGRTLFLRGREIKLFLGNLNALEIFYNNQYLKAKSINGVRSLIFPHELAKKSEIPFFIYEQEKGKYHLIRDIIDTGIGQ